MAVQSQNSGVKPKENKSKHFEHCALEVWSALYPNKPFGLDNENIISYFMVAMVYIKIKLKRKVDWRTVFIRNKEDKTKYAKADIFDNFSFFRQNVGDGLTPDAHVANQNTYRSKKSIQDKDSVEKTIYFEKRKFMFEDERSAGASRKLDTAIPRLEH